MAELENILQEITNFLGCQAIDDSESKVHYPFGVIKITIRCSTVARDIEATCGNANSCLAIVYAKSRPEHKAKNVALCRVHEAQVLAPRSFRFLRLHTTKSRTCKWQHGHTALFGLCGERGTYSIPSLGSNRSECLSESVADASFAFRKRLMTASRITSTPGRSP
ncbi:hypothetical protein BD310DRAFT_587564 [Dichomitus squalens]|uniref:Uncharacterized protein n=1 Tax=Dichomitus squalens TaxID=114155 RepID=A0A4Q9QAC2_9APHY|nr:hypothetical protein BD310DRAFT_587564 [Dichomitus squalens]